MEGERLVLERHPAYFRVDESLPRVGRKDLRLLPDSNRLLELLLTGELDTALVGVWGLTSCRPCAKRPKGWPAYGACLLAGVVLGIIGAAGYSSSNRSRGEIWVSKA